MNKDINRYLNEAVEEGIITNKQRLDLKLKLGRDKVDRSRRMSRVGDIVLSLIFITLILSSLIMVIQYNPEINPYIGVFISAIFIIFSIYISYDAIKRNNYFLKEIALMTNALSNIMLITSLNQMMTYNYYFPDNMYIGFIMTLPLLAAVNTYISRFIIIFVFCLIRIPYLNLGYLPLYNTTIISLITVILVVGTVYKLAMFLKSDYINSDESRFLSYRTRITIQEIILYLLIMKLNRIFFIYANVYTIYVIYIILLVRRSTIFKDAVEMPTIVDNLFFIYTAFFFVTNDVVIFHDIDVLVCHIIYYTVYFGLLKTDRLKNVDRVYKLQQQFYINLFLLTYIAFSLQRINTDEIIFITAVIVGAFNVYEGKVGMRLDFMIIGLSIVVAAILFTGNVAYSLVMIILVMFSLSFALNRVWGKIKKEVLRDNEK